MTTVGLRVGRYEVGVRLGKGGFGVVHLARDMELGREVAIKFLRPEYMTRTQVVQRFLQEARACAKIGHPGIVTVFEAGVVAGTGKQVDGTAYIVMERLHGESLGDRLQDKGRLPPIAAIGIARQLAAALAVAHDAGIIHRDLKPDNVYLVKDAAVVGGERVKILDFGVAKLADPEAQESVHTHSQMMLGTPRYMSPEQGRSASKVDHRTDIYALGCLLYELVVGKAPFSGDMGDILVAHQTAPIVPPRELVSSIPPALDALIVRMLAKEPDHRPATMHAVDEALDGVFNSIAPTAKRPKTAPPRSAFDEDDEKTTRRVELPSDDKTTEREGVFAPGDNAELRTPIPERATLVAPLPPTTAPSMPAPSPWWRYRFAIGGGAALLSGLIVYLILRQPAPAQVTTARPDAGVVGTVDAAVAIAHVVDAAKAPGPSSNDGLLDADRIVVECKSAQVDKRWRDLEACGVKLATARPDQGTTFVARAKLETTAASLVDSLKHALTAADFKRAASVFAAIPEDSVYRAQAQTDYNQAKGPVIDGLVAELNAYTAARDCAKHAARLRAIEAKYGSALADEGRLIARPCAIKTALPVKAETACDPDTANADEKAGNHAFESGNHTAALAAYERALRCKPAILPKVYMTACRAKAFDKAKRYFAQLGTNKEPLAQICMRQGFDPRH